MFKSCVMEKLKRFNEVFKIFQDKESYFKEISKKQSLSLIGNQILVICVFAFLFGTVMGGYHSFVQSLVAGLKLIVLFISTLLICFPSFFIVQQILGSKMSFRQMVIIILSGLVLTSAIALSFAPIILFFLITGNNYYFLQLLHIAIFVFSGIFGMRLIIEALKHACEEKNIYPQTGLTIFKVWVVILAFVGIQLAWNLRPFLGDKDQDFKLFRKYEGNFYTAIIYSIEQLVKKDVPEKNKSSDELQMKNSTKYESSDSSELIKMFEE